MHLFPISGLNHQINMTCNKVCMIRDISDPYIYIYIGYYTSDILIDNSMSPMGIALLLEGGSGLLYQTN